MSMYKKNTITDLTATFAKKTVLFGTLFSLCFNAFAGEYFVGLSIHGGNNSYQFNAYPEKENIKMIRSIFDKLFGSKIDIEIRELQKKYNENNVELDKLKKEVEQNKNRDLEVLNRTLKHYDKIKQYHKTNKDKQYSALRINEVENQIKEIENNTAQKYIDFNTEINRIEQEQIALKKNIQEIEPNRKVLEVIQNGEPQDIKITYIRADENNPLLNERKDYFLPLHSSNPNWSIEEENFNNHIPRLGDGGMNEGYNNGHDFLNYAGGLRNGISLINNPIMRLTAFGVGTFIGITGGGLVCKYIWCGNDSIANQIENQKLLAEYSRENDWYGNGSQSLSQSFYPPYRFNKIVEKKEGVINNQDISNITFFDFISSVESNTQNSQSNEVNVGSVVQSNQGISNNTFFDFISSVESNTQNSQSNEVNFSNAVQSNQGISNISSVGSNIQTPQVNEVSSINNELRAVPYYTPNPKKSASGFASGLSLSGGYNASVKNFGFITEFGLDINITGSKVGSDNNGEIELKNNFHFYLTEKMGYKFKDNMLTYITLGLGIKDNKVSYKDVISENKTTKNIILGFGNEVRVMNNKLGIFTEVNNIISLDKIETARGEVKTNNYQIKVGARYYL